MAEICSRVILSPGGTGAFGENYRYCNFRGFILISLDWPRLKPRISFSWKRYRKDLALKKEDAMFVSFEKVTGIVLPFFIMVSAALLSGQQTPPANVNQLVRDVISNEVQSE